MNQLYAGGGALALITVTGVLAWRRVPAVRSVAARGQRSIAVAGSATVGLALLAGWLVRPRVQTAHLDILLPLIEELQRRDGLRIDTYASYAEDSMQWMAWYLGPLSLAVAIAALAWLTYRALRGRAEPMALAVLVLCLGAGGPYWWSPSITPDQLWATRRFVPAAFPALAVLTVIGLAAAIEWANRRRLLRRPAALGPVLMGAAVIAVLVPPALVTQPIKDQVTQRGFTRPLEQTCDFLPADAAVLVVGEASGALLQQSVRSWCETPTARETEPLSPAQVSAMAESVRKNGHRLYLVGQDRSELDRRVSSPAPPVFGSGAATNDRNAMATLDHPPRAYGGPYTLQIFAVAVTAS